MTSRVEVGKMSVDATLHEFVSKEALQGTGLDADKFWADLEKIFVDLTPINKDLLAKRDKIQAQMDEWYEQKGTDYSLEEYKAFLGEIGYLVPEGEAFSIDTSNVDPEIASIAGPQLVVPITNARFAINAANARWGSLYDALYGRLA